MICTTMIVSGLLTALTAVVHTPAQLYLARFLLGAAQAGFFPSVIVYLSHWFIQEDRAKATGNFMAAQFLCRWSSHPRGGLDTWSPLVRDRRLALAFLSGRYSRHLVRHDCIFFLTDQPSQTRWLTAEQRQYISQKLEQENP
jgi:MFS transporter, ACS family, tartrate transporter